MSVYAAQAGFSILSSPIAWLVMGIILIALGGVFVYWGRKPFDVKAIGDKVKGLFSNKKTATRNVQGSNNLKWRGGFRQWTGVVFLVVGLIMGLGGGIKLATGARERA